MSNIKLFLSFVLISSMGSAFANTYVSPAIKTSFHYNSNIIGNYIVEVIAVSNDRYETQTKRTEGNSSSETRLFGIVTLEKVLGENILNSDATKASQIFPLSVGKITSFTTNGARPNGSSWSRAHKWEVVKSYEKSWGGEPQQFWTLKIFAESPGFFKFDGICEYSLKYSACVKIEGERFINGNARSTGPVKNILQKILIDGAEVKFTFD